MDPVSAAGLALSVAGLGLQIYTGCIAGIQLLITAANFPEDCRYLNLRLRMEQQRLFAWSETSGLTDLGDAGADGRGESRVLASNTFLLHRQTVLDLLVQVQCLFEEFRRHAERNHQLRTFPLEQQQHGNGRADEAEVDPESDAAAANFPLPPRRRDFIRKAMRALREKSSGATLRLRWLSFDKVGFETLLARFAALNDGMTGILDAGLQREIHHSVQDTNRGVLQLHRRVSDLGRLVRALNVRLEMAGAVAGGGGGNRSDLEHLSQLAKFKAFNESMEAGDAVPWDAAEAKCLELVKPNEQINLQIDRSLVILDPSAENSDAPRCEALLKQPDGTTKSCWVEWKEYEKQMPGVPSPPKEIIIERARKLAALLNHSPKPKEFRTPRCLGFFDMGSPPEDILNCRLGLIFERPQGPNMHPTAAPASLHDLLTSSSSSSSPRQRPSVTQRVRLAHALAHCLLYLHAVSWLHKGLRSTNILFFRTASGAIDHGAPLLSGFDFSRPARADEMTEDPPARARARDDLYRHPSAQSSVAALGSWTADGDGDGEGLSSAARPRSRRSFDIYSLGVLLVEVAHWRTVDRVLGIDVAGDGDAKRRISPRTALGVRARLLGGEVLAEVGACMGEVFEGAARRCVAGGEELGLEEGDDEASDAVAARLLMRFWADVVKVLGDVRV